MGRSRTHWTTQRRHHNGDGDERSEKYAHYTKNFVHTLIYLGAYLGDIISMPQIAEYYAISPNHLMKVDKQLTKLGYLELLRVRNGGLRFTRAPKEINIGKVVREIKMLDIVECFIQSERSMYHRPCLLRNSWKCPSFLPPGTSETFPRGFTRGFTRESGHIIELLHTSIPNIPKYRILIHLITNVLHVLHLIIPTHSFSAPQ